MCEPVEYRNYAEWLRSRAKRDPLNPSNLAILEAADEIDRLQKQLRYYVKSSDGWCGLADDLYAEVMKKFCWHCGHETTRNIDADRIAEAYRQRIVELGKDDE